METEEKKHKHLEDLIRETAYFNWLDRTSPESPNPEGDAAGDWYQAEDDLGVGSICGEEVATDADPDLTTTA